MKHSSLIFRYVFVNLVLLAVIAILSPGISLAACGLDGQDCCVARGSKFCTQPGTECKSDGKCRLPCGGENQNCCPGNVCVPPNTCQDGKCKTPPPPCGGPDQNCCANNVCTAPGYQCRDGKCRVICGGIDQPCCPGSVCLRPDAACENNRCVKRCGDNNQACCDGTRCNTGFNCVAGKCLPCGEVGLPCCQSGEKCKPGYVCDLAGLLCAQCGTAGKLCCPGNSCASGNVCLSGPEGARRCGPCGLPDKVCCPGNTCQPGLGLHCRDGKCQARDLLPDLAIMEVKGTGMTDEVAVTIKNVGSAPTIHPCGLVSYIQYWESASSSPSKWTPTSCHQNRVLFGPLLPGQSTTVKTCGYSAEKLPQGFLTSIYIENGCGGETNYSNNEFRIEKKP